MEPAMRNSRVYFLLILFLALVGLASSIYLTFSHYRILTGRQLEGSFCQISDLVDCDAVASSVYSEIFDIPWAAVGAVVYLLILSFATFGLSLDRLSAFSFRFIFGLASVSVLFDMYLALVGFVILRKICLICIATYIVNLGILFFSKQGSQASMIALVRGMLRHIFLQGEEDRFDPVIIRLYHSTNGVIILFSIVMIGLLRFHFVEGEKTTARRVLESLREQKPVAISLEGVPRLGPESAKVKIVEFSDFRCPYCKKMASVLEIVRKRYPKYVALYFKHYPLDKGCNPLVGKTLHVDSCKISKLAICTQEVGLFWELQDLFWNTDKRFVDNLKRAVASRGEDPRKLIRCAFRPETAQKLASDIQEAKALEVRVTPTIFINGYKLVGSFDPIVLFRIVEYLLAEPEGEGMRATE